MSRIILIISGVLLIAAFFIFDLSAYLTLDELKNQQQLLAEYHADKPMMTGLMYVLIYILVTALSLPGATILTLAGGAVFGLAQGLLMVSFASTIGATLAFLAARFLLRDSIQAKFGERLQDINDGIEREGAFYLFSLRLVPIFPFFMINLLMGLTRMKVITFYWVSQLGMLAGTAVFVNAGTELAKIDSLAGILSPALLASFVLLGVFPLASKKLLEIIKGKENA